MADRVNMAHTSLSRAARGERFPSWEATREFVIACHPDSPPPNLIDLWYDRWRAASLQVKDEKIQKVPPVQLSPVQVPSTVTSPQGDNSPDLPEPTTSPREVPRGAPSELTAEVEDPSAYLEDVDVPVYTAADAYAARKELRERTEAEIQGPLPTAAQLRPRAGPQQATEHDREERDMANGPDTVISRAYRIGYWAALTLGVVMLTLVLISVLSNV